MALKLTDLQVTNFATQINSSTYAGLANNDGLVILGWWSSTLCTNPPTTASVFAPGCIMLNTAGSSASTSIVGNSGSTASPTWTVFTIS